MADRSEDRHSRRDDPGSIARSAKRIAVVGASENPARASHQVMRYLIGRGYEVIPVRPGCESILEQPCVDSLAEITGPVDIVDVFRRSEAAPEIAKEAAAAGAGTLWLQDGISSSEAATIAREAGMGYVENNCLKRVLQWGGEPRG